MRASLESIFQLDENALAVAKTVFRNGVPASQGIRRLNRSDICLDSETDEWCIRLGHRTKLWLSESGRLCIRVKTDDGFWDFKVWSPVDASHQSLKHIANALSALRLRYM